MKKIIIPRKDHEVYFLLKPKNQKNYKELQQYVNENMEKQHPAFSEKSRIDIKKVKINENVWLMITVMEEEVLAEYKILNNNSFLFTNTSIMVYKKDFINNGIHIIDDESIGFNIEKNVPISVPIELKNNNRIQKLANDLKTISVRHALFNKKLPTWSLPLISACLPIILLILIITFINNSAKSTKIINEEILSYSQTANEADINISYKSIPPLIEILASISADIFNAGGRIIQWQSNKNHTPFILIQLQRIDLLNIYRLFSEYNYAILQDVQEIRYGDNNPYITVIFDLNKTEYIASPIRAIPMQDHAFNMITELSSALINNSVSITSEILPAAGNEYLLYTINYSVRGLNLVRSLEVISNICNKFELIVNNMNIVFNDNIFHVSCTLAYSNEEIFSNILLGDEKFYIPPTFGYIRESPVIDILVEDTVEYYHGETLIGSIKDDSGIRTFFRDNADGKIQVRVE